MSTNRDNLTIKSEMIFKTFKNILLIAFVAVLSLISCLSFLYYKLSIAHNAIEKLQGQHEALNSMINEFQKQNEKLLEVLRDLTLQNQKLQKIVTDLQSENVSLLETISEINLTKVNTSMFVDQNIFFKVVLGLIITGVLTYSGFTFVNFINANYANSSVGLLLSGINKHLIWLGEKTRIISQPEVSQTLIDQFNKTYIIEMRGDEVIHMLIDDGSELVEIGVFIDDLFANINYQRAFIDVLTNHVNALGAELPVEAVNTAIIIENAAGLPGVYL